MNYSQKLTLSMLVPTVMVAGAGSTVVLGAWWLHGQTRLVQAEQLADYLQVGGMLTALLTAICVFACVGFTVWIRRTARRVLGGDPSTASEALAALADGQLGVDVPVAAQGSLLDSVRRLCEVMQSALGNIRQASEELARVSQEIESGNRDLSGRTKETAESLQRTAGSMGELTQTVQASNHSAGQAQRLSAEAAEMAARGGAVVSQVVHTMQEINQSSRQISEIIGVIDGIAFQTNILALNAAVEAARAGEQGRGFAVVAGEVRLLASRSAEAAREIKRLIEASVTRVEAGSELVQQAGGAMQDIVGSVHKVGDMIGQIAARTTEQSNGLQDFSQTVDQLARLTQQNAILVEHSAHASESLEQQVQRLSQAVHLFRL